VESLPKSTVTHLVVDPSAGLMFVAAYSEPKGSFPSGAVYPFSMDGRAVEEADVMGGEKMGIPSGLALDTVTRTVFWTDLTSREIMSCSYEGRDCEVVVISAQLHPSHITYFAGVLYWTTGSLGTVHSFNLVSKVTRQSFLILPASSHSLLFQHPALQPPASVNPCSTLPCSAVCVLSGGNESRCLYDSHRAFAHHIAGSGIQSGEADKPVLVQMVDDTPRLTGGEVGVILAVVLMLVLVVVVVVVVVLVRRRAKRVPEVELRFTSMNDTDADLWRNSTYGGESQTSRSVSPGYTNPVFRNQAKLGQETDNYEWKDYNPAPKPSSENLAARNNAAGPDSVSRASSMASLNVGEDFIGFTNDKKQLL